MAVAVPSMAKNKDVVVQIRVDKEWHERVQVAADAVALPVSAYIRMAVSQRMDQDHIVQPPKKPKKPT